MDIADSDIEANERLGEGELRALQLERLRASLAHAYANNPAYARKFDEAGVNPEDVKSLERRFKKWLRDHPDVAWGHWPRKHSPPKKS